jgi:glycosyltransferase involved in cell wall biosynthesis
MQSPLVSVICLCYNHARFLEETVNSVLKQTYSNIELIIVDDASTDKSVEVIHRIAEKNNSIVFIKNDKNKGMCPSFNNALSVAKGEYIIDLAADDILLPKRVEKQIEAFFKLKENYGVVFSDACLIGEEGDKISTFYKRNELDGLMEEVPSGDVFKDLIRSYKICSPTLMIKKKVLDELGGYDENLSYEDYDFFVRSSREYKYFYIDEVLTLRRVVKGSDSSSWYKTENNTHLASTLIICRKALWLCRDLEEKKALLHSVRYHFRQSYFMNNFQVAKEYYELINQVGKSSMIDKIILYLVIKKIKIHSLYKGYLKIRRGI